MGRGKFITFEGPEGAGKTTLIRPLSQAFTNNGYEVVVTREPGGTRVGEQLRVMIKNSDEPLSIETELLGFSASRAQLVRQVILPHLERYQDRGIVLCDRFMDSTTAYQGFGRGCELESIQHLHRIAVGSCVPDLTLLLDLPVEAGLSRARARNERTDRFESEVKAFHERVRQGYLDLASKYPERIAIIDSTNSLNQVYSEAVLLIRERLGIDLAK